MMNYSLVLGPVHIPVRWGKERAHNVSTYPMHDILQTEPCPMELVVEMHGTYHGASLVGVVVVCEVVVVV